MYDIFLFNKQTQPLFDARQKHIFNHSSHAWCLKITKTLHTHVIQKLIKMHLPERLLDSSVLWRAELLESEQSSSLLDGR